MTIGSHHSTFLALLGTALVASCVITFLILFHEHSRVCIRHFDPFEGTDGSLFLGRTDDLPPIRRPCTVTVGTVTVDGMGVWSTYTVRYG